MMDINASEIEGYGFFYEVEENLYVACLNKTEFYWALFGPEAKVLDIVCFWTSSSEALIQFISWIHVNLRTKDAEQLRNSRAVKIVKNIKDNICSIV